MFGTAKVNPGPPPGSPLRIRTKDADRWDASNGDVEVGDVVEAQRRRIVLMLLKGKIYGLPGSDGTRWGNFREWAKNQHPVLSMFFAHELHPFSKSERLSVMLCYLCWAFFITIVFEGMNVEYANVCDPGCNNVYRGTLPGQTSRIPICGPGSGVNEDRVSQAEYNWNCDEITPWWVLSFFIALVTVPYSTILKFLATCACAQSLPCCLKACFECLGTIVLRFFGVLSIVWLASGIVLSLEIDGGMFLITYMTGVAKSWMYWPIIAGTVFTFKYKKQKSAFDEENPGQVAMAWPIDHTDPNVEVKVGQDGKPVAYATPPGSPLPIATATAAMNVEGQPQGPQQMQLGVGPNANGLGGMPVAPGMQGQFYGNGGGGGAGGRGQLVMQQPMMQPGSPPMSPSSDVSNVDGMNGVAGNMYGSAPPLQHPGYGAPQPAYASQPMATAPPLNTYGGGAVDRGAGALPPGWEMKMEPDGRMLYIDHNTKTTQWNPPFVQQQALDQPPGSPPSYAQHQVGPPAGGGGGFPGQYPAGYEGMQQQQQQQQQHHHHHHHHQQPPPGMYGSYPQQQPGMGDYPNAAMGGYPGQMQQQHQQQQQQYQQQPMGGFPGQLSPQQQYHQQYQPQQQPPPQPQAPAAVAAPEPKPVIMEFAVPDGVSAGDSVQINTTNGIISVTIPEGSKSGDTLQIPLPV